MTDIFGRYFEWELKIEQVQVVIHISVTLSTSLYLGDIRSKVVCFRMFESASVC